MLTHDQIDFFHTNGYLIMRGLIKGRELEDLQAAVEGVHAQATAREGTDHLYTGAGVYFRSERMWERGEIFRAVTVNPDLLENIGQCVGQPFFPWNDSMVVKVPHAGAVIPWHQDPPYGDPDRTAVYPVPNFTTDIYLDHSGPDNGCVWAIPGHHLVGHIDLKDYTLDELRARGAVPLEMEAGDVLFHCLSTPHGSEPNTSDLTRRIFYIHYLADEVFQDAYGKYDWAAAKPGWGEVKQAQIAEMIAARAARGLETPRDRKTLSFGAGGFRFVGGPTTAPRHWETLTAAIPAERRESLVRLEA